MILFLDANNAVITTLTSNDIRGRFTGDIYHPQGNKIFENGGPGAEIPATFTGNVLGTVSSLTNHTTNNLTEGSTNLYYTDTRVRAAISGGTGVDFSSTGVISIGQNVGTTANVGFKTVTATGDITAFGTISDITMKENINPISNALDKISQLGGYTFNYKGNETPMTGVMAQELQKVLPEAVYQTNDPTTNETVYAVRHGNVIGLLIEAIKELQEKVGK